MMKKILFLFALLCLFSQTAFAQYPAAKILQDVYPANLFDANYSNELFRNKFVLVLSGSDTVVYFVDINGARALMPMGATGGGGGGTVNVSSPLAGDGSVMTPVKFINGSISGQYLSWNGSAWVLTAAPSALGTGFTAGGGSGSLPSADATLDASAFFNILYSNTNPALTIDDDQGVLYLNSRNAVAQVFLDGSTAGLASTNSTLSISPNLIDIVGGTITATSGSGATGSPITLTAGDGSSGDGGSITVTGGTSDSNNGGDVVLVPGRGDGNNGLVKIEDPGSSVFAKFFTSQLTTDKNFAFPDMDGVFSVARSQSNTPASTPASYGLIHVDSDNKGLYISTAIGSATDWRRVALMDDITNAASGALAGSLLDLTQTWNTSGSPTAIKLNVTNTTSGASSNLIDLQVGGSSKFKVDKAGNITATNVLSGTYTGTVSNSTNTDGAVTVSQAQYSRTGNVVTVSGRFTADPTLLATATSFELTLPVASNIGAPEDCAGTAFCGNIAGMGASVAGVGANDTAIFSWKASDTTSQTWSFIFSYEVI